MKKSKLSEKDKKDRERRSAFQKIVKKFLRDTKKLKAAVMLFGAVDAGDYCWTFSTWQGRGAAIVWAADELAKSLEHSEIKRLLCAVEISGGFVSSAKEFKERLEKCQHTN